LAGKGVAPSLRRVDWRPRHDLVLPWTNFAGAARRACSAYCGVATCVQDRVRASGSRTALDMDHPGYELPVQRIPNIGPAVEFYFSPDGTRIIGIARREGDEFYRVHTLKIDGTDIRRIMTAARTRAPTSFRTASASSGHRPVITRNCRSAITPTPPTIRRVLSSTRRISTAATSAGSPTTPSTTPRSRCRPTAGGSCSADRPTARWTCGKFGRTERKRCRSPGSKVGNRAAASTSPTTAPSSSAPGGRSTNGANVRF
jgi:hypothetical protein